MSGSRKRVVITGLGVVAPQAIGVDAFWSRVSEGRSAISLIKGVDTSKLRCKIGGEVGTFDTAGYFGPAVKIQRYGKNALFGLVASVMALRDSKLPEALYEEVSLSVGISGSPLDFMGKHVPRSNSSPTFVPVASVNSATSVIAQATGIGRRSMTASTGCAAGLDAIALAYESIVAGKEEIVLAGGTDSAIAYHPFADFEACGMVSLRNDAPEKASRPFDLHRDGGVASEGAGICIVEELRHALARRAPIYAEIMGSGSGLDRKSAEHGSGLELSMREAMDNAGMQYRTIQYVNAHGPSDKHMDRIEVEAIKTVFGSHAKKLMVSSVKGVTGNPLAAAGGLQAVASSLVLQRALVHPTANYETADPACDLDFVPTARRVPVERMLINSHGVGGGNCSLALARYEA